MKLTDKIYIAGQSGIIGYAVYDILRQRGFQNLLFFPHKDLDLIIQADVEKMFEQERPQYVFFCAGDVGHADYFMSSANKVLYRNIMMQTNVIEAAAKYHVTKLLYIGSGSVYGPTVDVPFHEEQAIKDIQMGALESYAVSKIAGIELCKQYKLHGGHNFISALSTHIYGSRKNSAIKPALIENIFIAISKAHQEKSPSVELDIWGTGTKLKRQFMYIDDCANALIHLMECYDDALPVNVAIDELSTLDCVAKTIQSLVGYQGQLVYQTQRTEKSEARYMDVTRLARTGFRPQYSLGTGLATMCNRYSNISSAT